MKIRNDFVLIQSMKKNIKLHNTILQPYINEVRNRTGCISNLSFKDIANIFIKFDEELEFDEESILSYNDFNMYAYLSNDGSTRNSINIELEKNYCKIKRKVGVSKYEWYKKISEGEFEPTSDITEFLGRKITAIGWGYKTSNQPIYACLDTSNYDLYFYKDLIITRQDTITNDQIFTGTSNDKCYHLVLGTQGFHLDNRDLRKFVKINSIGLGYYPSIMEYETTEFTRTFDGNSIILSSLNLEEKTALFPASNLYPSENLYPSGATSRYFIIKYLYNDKYNFSGDGGYYYVATPINNLTGDLKLTINVERNDD